MMQLIIYSLVSICVRLSESEAVAGGQIIWVYGLGQQCWVAEATAGWCGLPQTHGQRKMPDTSNSSLFW